PEILPQANDVLFQASCHAHADAKRNRSFGAVAAIFIAQPFHQFLLPARRIPAEVIFLNGRPQCLKGTPRHRQGLHLRRHGAVPELVGQHQIHLCPQRQHRLISAAALTGRMRLALPTLDDLRIQIDGGNLLVGTTPSDLLHHLLVDLRQSSQWGAFLSDITHLTHRQLLLRLLDLLLVVKLVEKFARRFRARQLMPQHLRQASVLAPAIEIVQAIATQCVQHQEALDIAGFIETALSLLHLQVTLHAARYIQRAHGSHEKRNAGVGCYRFFQGLWMELEQKLAFGGGRPLLAGDFHRAKSCNSAPKWCKSSPSFHARSLPFWLDSDFPYGRITVCSALLAPQMAQLSDSMRWTPSFGQNLACP